MGLAQALQGVVNALQGLKIFVETDVHQTHADIFGGGLAPRFKDRVKIFAVRAAVREELHHLDLAFRGQHRGGLLQRGVTAIGLGGERQNTGDRAQQGQLGKFTTFHSRFLQNSAPLRVGGGQSVPARVAWLLVNAHQGGIDAGVAQLLF